MRNRTFVTPLLVFLLLLAATAVLNAPRPALGQMTIPTRTPKPETEPTNPPPQPEPTDDNGGGGNNNPAPTDPPPQETAAPPPAPTSTLIVPSPTATSFAVVPLPSATPTATPLPVTPSPSPSPTVVLLGTLVPFPGGSAPFPTAAPCSRPPTFQARPARSTVAHAGPGAAYAEVGQIPAGQARPIVGRAAFVSWWVVQLDGSGRSGWVADPRGRVQGDTGRVPIVTAPDWEGVPPTPASDPWVPTPNPDCITTVAPAATAAEETAAQPAAELTPPSSNPVIPAASAQAEDPSAEGTTLDISGETSARRGPGDAGAAADQMVSDLAARAEPLEVSTPPSAPNFMPIAGLVLVVAAVVLGVYLRRGPSKTPR